MLCHRRAPPSLEAYNRSPRRSASTAHGSRFSPGLSRWSRTLFCARTPPFPGRSLAPWARLWHPQIPNISIAASGRANVTVCACPVNRARFASSIDRTREGLGGSPRALHGAHTAFQLSKPPDDPGCGAPGDWPGIHRRSLRTRERATAECSRCLTFQALSNRRRLDGCWWHGCVPGGAVCIYMDAMVVGCSSDMASRVRACVRRPYRGIRARARSEENVLRGVCAHVSGGSHRGQSPERDVDLDSGHGVLWPHRLGSRACNYLLPQL
ncbi:hypothetical protein PYCCODRAFT_506595 [Trametes coccinea BRFM310]|uniref:Uncharacterized protein n=1 Tax=Trametes coccinea (strain BRFM310) TaxID=1353009 RepID=A0A1Y2IN35_TRAC3|nr:hypothetical protein PYCCODRAFT_506595 [Trametes coccinea BRFM310]